MTARPEFDEVIHAPNRLKICALLATATTAEFGTLRDALAVADSVTSKQLKVLTEAGYVKLSKPTGTGGRAKTWATLTPAGRRAFEGHLAMLQQMAADVSQDVGGSVAAPSFEEADRGDLSSLAICRRPVDWDPRTQPV